MKFDKTLTYEELFGLPSKPGLHITHFEDYGKSIVPVQHCKKINAWKWDNTANTTLIQEDSLQRTLKFVNGGKSFAILTAYRKEFSKDQNIFRNRKLRAIFNSKKMGVHQLVGHWLEKQKDGSETPVAERSYLVVKPDSMTDKEFGDLIFKCLTVDGATQDGAIAKFASKGSDIFFLGNDRNIARVGKKVNFDSLAVKLAGAYSQHVKKTSMPFVFDGEEVPQTILGIALYEDEGFKWS